MTDEDRSALSRAMEQAKARLPKGHKLDHVRWKDGVLQVASKTAKPDQDRNTMEDYMAELDAGKQPYQPPAKKPLRRGSVQVELPL